MKFKQVDTFVRDNALVDIIFNHKGKNNAIGTDELVKELERKGFKINKELVHGIVKRVTMERHLPICSIVRTGYYWATNKEDIMFAIDHFKSKIEGLQKRIDLLNSFIID